MVTDRSLIMPEIAIQAVIRSGLQTLRDNPQYTKEIFATLLEPAIAFDYGPHYVEKIATWVQETNLPVLLAWDLVPNRIPAYSVHLASEAEDEGKAATGDFYGVGDDDVETGTSTFSVMVDIGCHATKSSDHVLWMYYILNYILFRNKRTLEGMGLQLQTFSASDYRKDNQYAGEGIYTRWVRLRAIVQQTWSHDPLGQADDVIVNAAYGNTSGGPTVTLDEDEEEV